MRIEYESLQEYIDRLMASYPRYNWMPDRPAYLFTSEQVEPRKAVANPVSLIETVSTYMDEQLSSWESDSEMARR